MPTIVLVTGASGFVGRHLCARLAASGHQIHAVVRRPDSFLESLGARTWIGDLWDGALLLQALQGVDVVVHCAGDATFGNGPQYQRSNVELTSHLLACVAARERPVSRFVFVSTIGAVDRRRGDDCREPMDEATPPVPASDYGRSKLAAEDLVRASGLPFTIIRPTMVVGADMRFRSHFSVFARAALAGSVLGRVAWPGCFSVVHVDDLASALELAAAHPDAAGRTFFCAGQAMPLRDFLEACAPGRKRLPVGAAVSLARPLLAWLPFQIKALLLPVLTASDEALRSLGWRPRFSPQQALAHVIGREQARLDVSLDPGGQTVITGAASGLGRALTELLAPTRQALLLIDRDGDGLASLASRYGNCRTMVVDLASNAELSALVESPAWRQHPVRELFACAGFGARGTVQELPLGRQQAMFGVNVVSRLVLAHHAIDMMARSQFGRILFVSSSSAFQPLPYMAVYAASNAALLHLGEAWAMELAAQGVRLLTVCPGGMQTNFQASAGVREIEGERLMAPEEVARQAVAALAGPRFTLVVSFRARAMSLLARVMPRQASVALWAGLMKKMR